MAAVGESKDSAQNGSAKVVAVKEGTEFGEEPSRGTFERIATTDWYDLSKLGGVAGRMDQLVARLPPTAKCDIRVKDVSFVVSRPKGMALDPTLGDVGMSVLGLATCTPCRAKLSPPPMDDQVVLDSVNEIFKPSQLTLIIGPPGSGKSVLLNILNGTLGHKANNKSFSGDVLYNGRKHTDKSDFSLKRMAVMIGQREEHIPNMTVDETFRFAYASMGGAQYGPMEHGTVLTKEQLEFQEWMHRTGGRPALVEKGLGLWNARDTPVGDASLRGVSGGERRRVSLGEMLLGTQNINLFDSVSTGLDTSTTADLINNMYAVCHTTNKTSVVVLQQPPPEVFDVFDRVIVMAEGAVIFSGPPGDAKAYFSSLGYSCPDRKDVADFLVELPTPEGRLYLTASQGTEDSGAVRAEDDEETGLMKHLTPKELAAKWRETKTYKDTVTTLNEPHPLANNYTFPDAHTRTYTGDLKYHTKLALQREVLLKKRNFSGVKIKLCVSLFLAIIVGSIFWDTGLYDTNARLGVLFFALLNLVLGGIAELAGNMARRPTFFKQAEAGFFPPASVAVASALIGIPELFVQTLIFCPILYFMVGFRAEFVPFLLFTLIIFLCAACMHQAYRLLAAVGPDFDRAQGMAGIFTMLNITYCGFLIARTDIPPFWIWMYWFTPVSWAFRALAINELTADKFKDACAVEGQDPCLAGSYTVSILEGYGFFTDTKWIYLAIAYIIAVWLVFIVLTCIAFQVVRFEPEGDGGQREGGGDDSAADDLRYKTMIRSLSSKPKESSLDFTPVTLAFTDLWYSVPHPNDSDGRLDLLQGVSGYFLPGTMTALMGSSGAGKTTLLDVIAGRKTGGEITGTILLNGFPKVQETFNRLSGYVEQMDAHSPKVSVYEAIAFSAALRLDSGVSREDRKKWVDEVISMLELEPIRHRLAGSPGQGGLSLQVEQAKRLTIGVELAANPALLFLDEPTSGLDARAAQVVMKAIKKVASTGRTVICTIHQPSTYLFEMFDSLLLLKKGGQTVFFGPLGHRSSSLISYLSAIPQSPPIKCNANPATWMLECIGAGTSGKVDTAIYAAAYEESDLCKANGIELSKHCRAEPGTEPVTVSGGRFAQPLWPQTQRLFMRALKQFWRAPQYTGTRMFVGIIVAFVYGSNYIGKSVDTETELVSRFGLIFVSLIFMSVIFSQQTVPFFTAERAVYYRESAASTYAALPWAATYGIVELPFLSVTTLVYCSIFYFLSGFEPDATKFFYFWGYFTLYIFLFTSLGTVFTVAISSAEMTQQVNSNVVSVMSLFAGFLIGPSLIPSYWIWAYWLDPQHYAYEGMIVTQFFDNTDMISTVSGQQVTIADRSKDFFGSWSLSHRVYDIFVLFGFIAMARVLFWYAISHIRHETR